MNAKKQVQNPILFELLIVVLFFALSACLLIQLFSGAYIKGWRADSDGAALNWAEDMAERYYASGEDAAEFLALEGWVEASGGYARVIEFSGREYMFMASVTLEAFHAGHVSTIHLSATQEGRDVLSLPAAKYIRSGLSAGERGVTLS